MKSFVFIGHVDTGKSTLCGNLLYQCKHVSEHEMNKIREEASKIKMEKWVWAHVLDFNEEEKIRGKTHEHNIINFQYQDHKYQLIDTPGHQTFIRAMIEGIYHQADIGVLLVSMMENEFISSFERGMLKEHLMLVRSLGLKHLIIAANKMDTIDWDEKKMHLQVDKVKKFLSKINWKMENVHLVPMSAFHGINLVTTDKMPDWYTAKSFLETINNIPVEDKKKVIISDEPKSKYNILSIKTTVLNAPEIMSTGFKCMMHFHGEEVIVEIKKIKNSPMLVENKKFLVIFQTEYPLEIGKERVIFRKNDQTLGFGLIDKGLLKTK